VATPRPGTASSGGVHRARGGLRADRPDRGLGAQDRVRAQPDSSEPGRDPLTVSVNLSARSSGTKHLLREIERALSESSLKRTASSSRSREHLVMRDTKSSKKILDGIKSMASGWRSTTSARAIRPSRRSSGSRSTASRSTASSSRTFRRTGRRRDHAGDHRDGAQPAAEGDRGRRGDQEQLDFSPSTVPRVPGYFFRRPQPAEDFSKLLRDNAGR